MPAASRDFTITYGALTIGASVGRPITGLVRIERSMDVFSAEFDFVIRADSPSAFAAEIATVESAFSTKYQALTITCGTGDLNATWYNLSPSGAVDQFGFDTEPELSKPGSPMDSALSRLYRAKITMGLPANKLGTTAGRLGRRESKVSVAFSESRRRTITISGVYTGVPDAAGSKNARANYDKAIDAYASAVLTNVAPSPALFEVVGEPITEIDDTIDTGSSTGMGRVCRFVRVYQEILLGQGQGSISGNPIDDQRIVNQRIFFHRRRDLSGIYSPEARPLEAIDIDFSCSVRAHALPGTASPQQDVDYTTALKKLYDETIRPFLIQAAMSIVGSSGITPAITFEDFTPNYDENTIAARLTIMVSVTGTVYQATIIVEDAYESGEVLVAGWTGNNLAKYNYQGPGKRRRTVTYTKRVKGVGDPKTGTGDPIRIADLPRATSAILIDYTITHSPIRMGAADLPGGNFQDFTDITIRYSFEFFKKLVPFGTTTAAGPFQAGLDDVEGFSATSRSGAGGIVPNFAPGS